MVTYRDIETRMKAVGMERYFIDHERGVAVVFFQGLLAEETPRQTEERRRRELKERYHWAGYELRRREQDVVAQKEAGA